MLGSEELFRWRAATPKCKFHKRFSTFAIGPAPATAVAK